MRRGRAQPCPNTACQTTHNAVPASCKTKKNAQLYLFLKNVKYLSFFFCSSASDTGVRSTLGELTPKIPFLNGPRFQVYRPFGVCLSKTQCFSQSSLENRGLGRSPNRRHSPTLNKNVMSCSVACIRYSPSFAMPSSRGGRSEAQQIIYQTSSTKEANKQIARNELKSYRPRYPRPK